MSNGSNQTSGIANVQPPPLSFTLRPPEPLWRKDYATLYGPTTDDRIRLADTNLIVRIEQDWCGGPGRSGDEMLFGGGKVIRESMGQSHIPRDDPKTPAAKKPVDTVITGALIIDYWGVVKADVGLRDGKIKAIGQAYNPETMTPKRPARGAQNFVVGPETEVISGNGRILTAGGIDTHVHFLGPGQIHEALASGVTTLIGGGTGPAEGSRATTVTPGKWHLRRTFEALDAYPVNIGLFGKGGTISEKALKDQILAGAIGLKVHEDWGATPAAIDKALKVCDTYNAQVALHADSMNESGFVEDTFEATKKPGTNKYRGIHVFHVEGAGGGHAPDIMKLVGTDPKTGKDHKNVLPASTNPTRPLTKNTVAEHMYMMVICHHLNLDVPADRDYADSRIRPSTMAAEDLLHDTGAISMMSSDSQAMGRIGEMITRTWQTAHVMKGRRTPHHLPEDDPQWDNFRVRRYIAKYTINPAIAHGIDDHVGSVEKTKLADLVLWEPKFFGVKPHMVIKGGQIAYAQVGDANASIPTPQPYLPRPVWGACGLAPGGNSFNFVVPEAVGIKTKYKLTKGVKKTKSTRKVTKQSMKLNGESPEIEIGPNTFKVTIGEGRGTYTREDPDANPFPDPDRDPPKAAGAYRGTTWDAKTKVEGVQMFDKSDRTPDPAPIPPTGAGLYETELPMAQRYFLF